MTVDIITHTSHYQSCTMGGAGYDADGPFIMTGTMLA